MYDSRRVWYSLKENFSIENSVRTFHPHKEIAFLTQSNSYVSVYFSKLSDLWDEFDVSIPPPPFHFVIVRRLRCLLSTYKNTGFSNSLLRLNDSYSRAKSQIFMMQPLPSIN